MDGLVQTVAVFAALGAWRLPYLSRTNGHVPTGTHNWTPATLLDLTCRTSRSRLPASVARRRPCRPDAFRDLLASPSEQCTTNSPGLPAQQELRLTIVNSRIWVINEMISVEFTTLRTWHV
ncbi:hypothetical protein CBL_11604 [Carabus blaptoides fortunei]